MNVKNSCLHELIGKTDCLIGFVDGCGVEQFPTRISGYGEFMGCEPVNLFPP